MRQRLAIAAALLMPRELLVLDEPTNGLDPQGTREVRHLVASLASDGTTVFVSSHLLSEVQQTADRVAILARGHLVKAGAVDEVLSGGRARGLVIRVEPLDEAVRALADAGIQSTPTGHALRIDLPADDAPRVTKALADRGLYLSELRHDEVDLETVFLELTRDEEARP
jgi:ABC-2 type transport system ATP-binding protein